MLVVVARPVEMLCSVVTVCVLGIHIAVVVIVVVIDVLDVVVIVDVDSESSRSSILKGVFICRLTWIQRYCSRKFAIFRSNRCFHMSLNIVAVFLVPVIQLHRIIDLAVGLFELVNGLAVDQLAQGHRL